jgi:hypothetical protein
MSPFASQTTGLIRIVPMYGKRLSPIPTRKVGEQNVVRKGNRDRIAADVSIQQGVAAEDEIPVDEEPNYDQRQHHNRHVKYATTARRPVQRARWSSEL